jgi:exosortase A-associated hydrolase 2
MSYRGACVYVHPFGEEMNKSRRMAALQARAFARAGFGVLQIDLFGCGDSSGDFAEARWQIWKDDLAAAMRWLEDRQQGAVGLWGLRLGALLALDFAVESRAAVDRLLLWQPVLRGESFLTQFLRTKLASDVLAGAELLKAGTKEMRAALDCGERLEVAGYEIAPDLAASIDRLDAATLTVPNCPVHWFELISEPGRPMPPAAARVASGWQRHGADVNVHLVPGPAFWATQEITECPGLLASTMSIIEEVPA